MPFSDAAHVCRSVVGSACPDGPRHPAAPAARGGTRSPACGPEPSADGPSASSDSHSAVKHNWPEYGMEAALLGIFMVSACVFTVLLEHPASAVPAALPDALLRRLLIGMAMGLTAIALIYSPWGKQSGAHFNPAVTLTFLRLGKIAPLDAFAYVVAHCFGAIAGVQLARLALGPVVADPPIRFAVTVPGPEGLAVAFAAELGISFLLMLVVLTISNSAYARFTGVLCGLLVAIYITVEAPFSGMSMNPARTLGSAVAARVWTAWWVYLTAPPLGMLLAAEVYNATNGAVACAKLHHQNNKPCIFCAYQHPQRS